MDGLTIRDRRYLNRENSRLEVKSARMGIPQSLWESCSAFSYTSGGAIVLGLDESVDGGGFTVTGVRNARGYRNLRL